MFENEYGVYLGGTKYEGPVVTYEKFNHHPSLAGMFGGAGIGLFSNDATEDSKFPSFVNEASAIDREPPSQDLEKIGEIKGIIAEAHGKSDDEKFEATKKIEEIVTHMSNGETLGKALSPEEIGFFDNVYTAAKINVAKSITSVISDIADDANAVFNHEEFKHRVYVDSVTGTDTLSGKGIPVMHTLVNIFSFINPAEGKKVQNTIFASTQVAKGAMGIINALGTDGIAAIAGKAFSVSSGDFLVGLSLLFSIFGDQPNPNAEVLEALQNISNQIGRMHNDMLEGFRHLSLGLEFISKQFAEAFDALMKVYAKNHEEVRSMLHNIKKVVYVSLAILDVVLDGIQDLKKNDYLKTIKEADWSQAISDVESDCEVYEDSLSLDLLRKDLRLLVDALKNVQKTASYVRKLNFMTCALYTNDLERRIHLWEIERSQTTL